MCKYKLRNNINELDKESEDKFHAFMLSFLKADGKQLVYRGDSDENLYGQYGANTTNINLLSDYLFLIGAKGHSFWTERESPIKIMEPNNEVIIMLWKTIRESLGNKRNSILLFNDNNQDNFVRKVNELEDEDKEKIINYYYSYLHTIGSEYIGSYFLSTTKDFSIAIDKFSEDDIVLIGWVPTGEYNTQLIRYVDICDKNDYIENLGFPLLEPNYIEEQEICLKCGLLPHYTLGYIVNSSNTFIMNPAIIEAVDKKTPIDNIISNGFSISQTDFLNKIKEIQYNKCYRFEKGYYSSVLLE